MPLLLVDDEEQILLSYSVFLRSAGIDEVVTVSDSSKVMHALEKGNITVVILDLVMPRLSGRDVLRAIRLEYPSVPVIVMTAMNEIETAVDCMREGAFDYLVKPVEKSRFVSSVRKALDLIDLREEVAALRKQISGERPEALAAFSDIITRSPKMLAIFRYAEAVAVTNRPVCITGETGTGKELMARAIYNASGLEGKFIPVNVAGLDDTMFSDTLFGHKKGAFTGADNDREGLISRAEGGVLLLDEIGDLNEMSQLKLLRLIEEQKYYPLGSDVPYSSAARIVATTNRDLNELVQRGVFRSDLYYRLASHLIHLPPLQERPEDFLPLFKHFLEQASKSLDKKTPSFSKEIITLLRNCRFPGNIRELQAKVFDAVARHKSGIMPLKMFRDMLPDNVSAEAVSGGSPNDSDSEGPFIIRDRFPTLKESESYLISEALKRADGNQGIAASMLGMTRQALNKRLRRAD